MRQMIARAPQNAETQVERVVHGYAASMASTRRTHRMLFSWKCALLLLGGASGGAAVAAVLELSGAFEPGALIEDASDAERWIVVGVACLAVPYCWTCLRNAYLTLDDESVSALAFFPIGHQRTIRFRDVGRWGYGSEQNRGRRHTIALFEDREGRRVSVKLQMYEDQREILDELTERLGPPAPTHDTLLGLRFVG